MRRRPLTGNSVLDVNGVTVRADRAVINDEEVSLEGNVRLTLPQPKESRRLPHQTGWRPTPLACEDPDR